MVHASLYLRPDRESALSEHRSIDADDGTSIKRETAGASTRRDFLVDASKANEKASKDIRVPVKHPRRPRAHRLLQVHPERVVRLFRVL
jgi:hypothetical protein